MSTARNRIRIQNAQGKIACIRRQPRVSTNRLNHLPVFGGGVWMGPHGREDRLDLLYMDHSGLGELRDDRSAVFIDKKRLRWVQMVFHIKQVIKS